MPEIIIGMIHDGELHREHFEASSVTIRTDDTLVVRDEDENTIGEFNLWAFYRVNNA